MHGFVDIHNHILPGIDDGAKTAEESIDLIQGFSEIGVTNFVCTPHIMNHYYPNTSQTIKASYDLVIKEMSDQNIQDISLDFAAEHMIDDNFETILANEEAVSLKNDYLLVEMSYLQPSYNFNLALEKIAHHGFFPILAHPERYVYFHQDNKIYSQLKSKGVLFQLNLLSLSDYYGKEISKVAEKLITNQMVEYVASDIHNMRHLNSLKEVKVSNSMLKLLLPIIENTILTFY